MAVKAHVVLVRGNRLTVDVALTAGHAANTVRTTVRIRVAIMIGQLGDGLVSAAMAA